MGLLQANVGYSAVALFVTRVVIAGPCHNTYHCFSLTSCSAVHQRGRKFSSATSHPHNSVKLFT
jgi:hypothetical protein